MVKKIPVTSGFLRLQHTEASKVWSLAGPGCMASVIFRDAMDRRPHRSKGMLQLKGCLHLDLPPGQFSSLPEGLVDLSRGDLVKASGLEPRSKSCEGTSHECS